MLTVRREELSVARAWLRRKRVGLKMWARQAFGSASVAVPAAWLRKPSIKRGDRVCLLVVLARAGKIPAYSAFHLKRWNDVGFKVIVIVVGPIADFVDEDSLVHAAGIILRENRGYDFGAWAATIILSPGIKEASVLAIANDSLLGPLSSFDGMVARAIKMDADVVGTTESYERTRHFQSFLIFFKSTAISSVAFSKFWNNVKTGDRDFVVRYYETSLVRAMEKGGLNCVALFPAKSQDTKNQTLYRWLDLIEAGFPYVKISLLRDNPYEIDLGDWRGRLLKAGYEPSLIDSAFP